VSSSIDPKLPSEKLARRVMIANQNAAMESGCFPGNAERNWKKVGPAMNIATVFLDGVVLVSLAAESVYNESVIPSILKSTGHQIFRKRLSLPS
jgi:hypothetical protein